MASVGLPGTSGFVGEFLSLVGTYRASSWAAIVATTGIILGAAYMLLALLAHLLRRGAHAGSGGDDRPRRARMVAARPDRARRCFWMGIYPESFLRPIRNDVGRILTRLEHVAPAGRFRT